MDFYLDPENCYQRLEDEFKNMENLFSVWISMIHYMTFIMSEEHIPM